MIARHQLGSVRQGEAVRRYDARREVLGWALIAALAGCGPTTDAADVAGMDETTSSQSEGTLDGDSDDGGSSGIGSSGVDDGVHSTTGDEPTEYCPDPAAPRCCDDLDADGIVDPRDNEPSRPNPDQANIDGDPYPDVSDDCPTLVWVQEAAWDSDNDGVGNRCDTCARPAHQYNREDADVPAYMRVRNIPTQTDTDRDGIGDVCDNCVVTANCLDYGPDNPYAIGDPIDVGRCADDLDDNMVGDACEGQLDALAAGPVGTGADDDFDQDGIANIRDACPRQPVPVRTECTSDEDCPPGQHCETDDGVCDHADQDDDGVGDVCDSCPFSANPMQVVDGAMQEDDEDGDFVGAACEPGPACLQRVSPVRMGFYEFASAGRCCTVELVESDDGGLIIDRIGLPLRDPDDRPVRVQCDPEEQVDGLCVPLPPSVATRPGVLTLPPGCDEALGGADNPPLTPDDVGGDLVALWDSLCFLPPIDQDFDGLGDRCDLCEYAFDPANEPYVDDEGMLWEDDGHVCHGPYHPC